MHYSPLLKTACVRQVVLDKWLSLNNCSFNSRLLLSLITNSYTIHIHMTYNIHTHILHISIYLSLSLYIYIYMCCVYIYIYMCCVYIYIYICIYIYIYIHIYIYIYICIYIYILRHSCAGAACASAAWKPQIIWPVQLYVYIYTFNLYMNCVQFILYYIQFVHCITTTTFNL